VLFRSLLLHGWPGATVVALLLMCFGQKKPRVLCWCLITFHLHLLCDLIGSRGPTVGDLWPICYSEPLFRHPIWFWKGQWKLDGWQNQTIFVAVFASAFWLSAKRGYSFLEIFGRRLDSVFAGILGKWRNQLFKPKPPV
jgi:inner membrane protein